MSPRQVANKFILDLLDDAGIVSGRIYNMVAPQGATFPYVIVQLLSGQDLLLQEKTTTDSVLQLYIKAVQRGEDVGSADVIEDAIYQALHDQHGTQDGYEVHVHRIGVRSYTEPDNGQNYIHSGGIYRVVVQHDY